jgi:hypothetical protein
MATGPGNAGVEVPLRAFGRLRRKDHPTIIIEIELDNGLAIGLKYY